VTDPDRSLWIARLGYAGLALVLLAAPLLPLSTVPRPFATPDILLAVTLAWAARRPDTLPVAMVAATFLLADFLFQRPPGLFAALVIVATEGLRRRSARLRRGPFLAEWVAVGVAMAVVLLGHRLGLAALMTPRAPLGLTLIQVIMTIAAYPIVALLAHVALGLRRPAQGEVDTLGHRL